MTTLVSTSTLSVCSILFLLAVLVISLHDECCLAFQSLLQHPKVHHQGTTCNHFASSAWLAVASVQDQNEAAAASSTYLPRVLCIGEALWDCIADESARGMNVNELLASKRWTAFPGGATANVAAACAKLGTRAAFAGCVGDDDDGRELIKILGTNYGVDVSLVQQQSSSQDYPTRRVMVTRDQLTGDRAFGAFFPTTRAADDFADAHFNADVLLKQAEPVFQQLEQSSYTMWMVCGTLSLAYPESARAIRAMVQRGKAVSGIGRCRLLVDVNWRPVFWKCSDNHDDTDSVAIEMDARRQILKFLQYADVIKLTDEEAEWLLGIPAATSLEEPTLIAKEFPKAFAVLVTAGEKGASYSMWHGTISGRVSALDKIEVVETTGAGDAFTAGFLHQLILQQLDGDWEDIARKLPLDQRAALAKKLVQFASIVGGLTCTAQGAMAAQPTLSEVESYMATNSAVAATATTCD
jgi:fructokinase